MSLDEWRESERHLPEFLRDFHAQKRVFKYLGTIAAKSERPLPSWTDAHCYTIDIFLWMMARFGWTLQRSRAHVDYDDLESELRKMDERETEALRAFLEQQKGADHG